jgi:hypothetical protein
MKLRLECRFGNCLDRLNMGLLATKTATEYNMPEIRVDWQHLKHGEENNISEVDWIQTECEGRDTDFLWAGWSSIISLSELPDFSLLSGERT